jgi:pheromone shutdown protein TraB
MISRLLSTENEKIVAVVGDAHVEGIAQGLRASGVDVRVIRLREITDSGQI